MWITRPVKREKKSGTNVALCRLVLHRDSLYLLPDGNDIYYCSTYLKTLRHPPNALTLLNQVSFLANVLVNAAKILRKQLDVKGLFQTQGSLEGVNQLINALNMYKPIVSSNVSVHNVAEMIKVYLTRLSPVVIPDEVMKLMVEAHQSKAPDDYSKALLRFREISPGIVPSVHYVLRLFKQVSERSQVNGMDTGKMATIFVIDILKLLCTVENDGEYETNRLQQVQKLPYDIMAIEHLIKNVHLFEVLSPAGGMGSSQGYIGEHHKKGELKVQRGKQKSKYKNEEKTKVIPAQDLKVLSNVTAENEERPLIKAAINSPCENNNTINVCNAASGVQQPTHCVLPDGNSESLNQTATKTLPSVQQNITGDCDSDKKSYDVHKSKSLVKATSKKLKGSVFLKTRKGLLSISPKRTKCPKGQQQQQSHLHDQQQQKVNIPKEQHESRVPKGRKGKGRQSKGGIKPPEKQNIPTIFKTHEELLPWTEVQIDHDDSQSLMSRTILNPNSFRFLDEYHLAVEPSTDNVEVGCSMKAKRTPGLSNDGIKTLRMADVFTTNFYTDKITIDKNPKSHERMQSNIKRRRKFRNSEKVNSSPAEQPNLFSNATEPYDGDNSGFENMRAGLNHNACINPIFTNRIKITNKERRLLRPKRGDYVNWIVDIVLSVVAILCVAYVYHL